MNQSESPQPEPSPSVIKKHWRDILYYGLIVGIISFYILNQLPHWKKHSTLEGKKIDPLFATNPQGHTSTFPDLKRPSIIIFWATWCAPCKIELKRFQKACENKELDPSQIYAVSIGEALTTVQNYIKETPYSFNVLVDPHGKNSKRFAVAATPTIAHIKAGGEIAWITSGVSPLGIWKAKNHLNDD